MVDLNGQTFEEGDTVRFVRATLPQNRTRVYEITAVKSHGIEATTGEFTYEYTFATATRIGITHHIIER
ncbi:hypothetical protein [Streptomyces sp. NPDC059783]|uniref:hypothetical protein n=1 Tax=Streptomyces sp. NPDC059783 TaxID=3346944 RepID=UPI00365626B0